MRKSLTAFLFCMIVSLSGNELARGIVFHCDFSKKSDVVLRNKAEIRSGALRLNGKTAHALIPGSEKFDFSRSGMTLALTLRMNNDLARGKAAPENLDMFCAKGKEFIFARQRDQLYFNFHNGKTWCATTIGGTVPLDKKWNHYILTVEHFNDPAQGEKGYKISMYVNGELEFARRINDVTPMPPKSMIDLGKGFGGPWFLDGEIANFTVWNRPLSESEAAGLAASEKRVKIVRKGFVELPDEAAAAASSLKNAQLPARWVSEAAVRALSRGASPEKYKKLWALLKSLRSVKDFDLFARQFNKAQKSFVLALFPAAAYLAETGQGSGNHPLLGMYDRKAQREIFGERTISWEIICRSGNTKENLSGNSPDVTWEAEFDRNKLKIVWQGMKKLKFKAFSELELKNGRFESSFSLTNADPARVIEEVFYPQYAFAKVPGKKDFLAYPFMSGVEVPDPTVERFIWGQEAMYPSGRVTMQFGAYYNGQRGIYFGFEDGLARSKNFSVSGKRANLNVKWGHPVAVKAGSKGGNHFAHNGRAAVELYDGGWYEAGAIYRRFLEKKAAWWIKDLPRKSTPGWFRNNTMWMLCSTPDEKRAANLVGYCYMLKKYLELPFGVHWYNWNDINVLHWPHYPEQKFTKEINRQLRALGVYTVPYIDTRLWPQLDGPGGKSDYMYTSHGAKYAAKDRQGKPYTETYSASRLYSIMCPAVPRWRKIMADLMIRLADAGFDGVYHDQVATGSPRMCFDRSHGHLLNDPALWLEGGYWPMFAEAFKTLRKKHPDYCHTTEENAEPYLKEMDGFMVWRWTDAGQIPLYQSIYSGRAQFVGRVFNSTKPGDRQSFFSKVGQQLVNSEQIGWFPPQELLVPDARRLYVKKTMHLRLALLDYFNQGRMLAPLKFDDMPKDRAQWGGNFPQIVPMPKIANSAWLGADGTKMYLFTNTQMNETVSVTPQINSVQGFWICREGAEKAVFSASAPRITLAPLASEIWIAGDRKKAALIQKTMKKIASFDMGEKLQSLKNFKAVKLRGIPGKLYTARDAAGLAYCTAAADNSHVGWIEDGAFISFGEVDFGKNKVKSVTVRVAVAPAFEGGQIQLLAAAPGKMESCAGTLSLESTGGWKVYKEFKIALKQPLTGRQNISFRVIRRAACNFAGWKY